MYQKRMFVLPPNATGGYGIRPYGMGRIRSRCRRGAFYMLPRASDARPYNALLVVRT